MAANRQPFGRMVLALPHSALDYPAVEAAAEMAESLGMQCLGAFIIEPAISSLSERSGAQEFRSIATGWQPVEGESLARELEEMTENARRRFAALVRDRTTEAIFQLAHGGSGQILASLAGSNDIVVMIEPRHPADRITHQFRNFVQAAFDTSSSVMLVPSRIIRKRGPVVAIATAPDDQAIKAAAGIAGVMRESLRIINATGAPLAREAIPFDQQRTAIITSRSENMPIERRVLADLGNAGERLIVGRRGDLDEAGSRVLAGERGVPILVVGGSGRAF